MRTPIRNVCTGFLLAALAAPVAVYAQVTYPFDLPAQRLADSLRMLGTEARISVIFDPGAIRDRKAPVLKGSYTTNQALAKLLEGTGLTAEFTNSTTVVVKAAPPSKPAPGNTGQTGEKPAKLPETQSYIVKLDTVQVGSLLPRSLVETASAVITLTADDIKARGFSSVADALQSLSVNTGAVNNTSVQGNPNNWSVKTVSLFGFDPSFTKFLIDGRPMPTFSQAIGGAVGSQTSDQLLNNLSSIPLEAVERIEVLPGGSMLYGSDAIAGVVNIVLKKNVESGSITLRDGFYPSGGGRERLLGFTDSFHFDKLSVLVSAQVNDQKPMWALQRRLTAQNYADGSSPQQPSGTIGVFSDTNYANFLPYPNACNSAASLWHGTLSTVQDNSGTYCGTPIANAFNTLINASESAGLSLHVNYDAGEHAQLYADIFDNYSDQSRQIIGTSNYANVPEFYDPNLQQLVLVSRQFAPEEISSNLDDGTSAHNYENMRSMTFGGKGDIGAGWSYDLAYTRSDEHLDSRQIGMYNYTVPGSWGAAFLGQQLGTQNFYGYNFPVYAPNYAFLYQPLTPAQYNSYLGAGSDVSDTRTDQVHLQVTQPALFSLPGGNAALALVAETGFESWKLLPTANMDEFSGFIFAPADGHRTRYAGVAELNMPVFSMLTLDAAARYDHYDSEGNQFGSPTYSLGVEFRPFESLLLRGNYHTSFKAPSLADQFEQYVNDPNSYGIATDVVNCYLYAKAYGGGSCPFQYQYSAVHQNYFSNPALQPLKSRNLSYGIVWSPSATFSVNVDYQHIVVHDETLLESPALLLQDQLLCIEGTLSAQSQSCQTVNAQIQRGPSTDPNLVGPLESISLGKINLAEEINNSINAGLNYKLDVNNYGKLLFSAAYTLMLKHEQQTFPGDPLLNFLSDPTLSTEFHNKLNASVTWTNGPWSATLFGMRFGKTPNCAAQQCGGVYEPALAGTLAPWMIYNASVGYSVGAWKLALRINNLNNSMPPVDRTMPGNTNTPFNVGNYNPYGREVFLDATWRFGGGKNG
jgi:iron complex outermembrane receptor protein